MVCTWSTVWDEQISVDNINQLTIWIISFLNCLAFLRETFYLYICSAAETAPRPSYPSSKAKKDWDKLEAEVKKEVWSRFPLIYVPILLLQLGFLEYEWGMICVCIRRRKKNLMVMLHWTNSSVTSTRMLMKICGGPWWSHSYVIFGPANTGFGTNYILGLYTHVSLPVPAGGI